MALVRGSVVTSFILIGAIFFWSRFVRAHIVTTATTSPQNLNSLIPLTVSDATLPLPITESATQKYNTTKTLTTADYLMRTTLNKTPFTETSAEFPTEPAIATTTDLTKQGQACPLPNNLDTLTQNQFSAVLTKDCRYDKLTKPHSDEPLEITLQLDVRHLEATDQLQIRLHLYVQYSYRDDRLRYDRLSPLRGPMVGEEALKSRIWVPHLIITNERDISIMGFESKDVYVSISPRGEVFYSYRMSATIYCWMDLKKFPFDEQVCHMNFQSWTYNTSELLLKWDNSVAVKVASPLHLTEFTLENFTSLESFRPAPVKGGLSGNFSTLTFQFRIAREVGHYVIDYFIPSIMLVCTSWVTFWLQADQTPPRVVLGTSTMLSFITLASGQTKTLPKVSYIKVSEIWFLGCTLFIFASMVEFAFVNIIWRRKKKVELKKVNSKYILKSTLTPRLARKELQQFSTSSSSKLYKTRSCSSLNSNKQNKDGNNENNYNNYLTVHSFTNIPTITAQSEDPTPSDKEEASTAIEIPETDSLDDAQHPQKPTWTTMTPHEVAIWIDKKSRLAFPIAFLIFNLVFWTVVLSS